jgi:heterodisulfide reductase subunit D
MMKKKIDKPPRVDDLYACLQCGYCRSICPIYAEKGWESFTPRGKLYWMKQMTDQGFIDKLLGRKIEPTEEWINAMFSCTLCSRCETECHVNIKFHEFWDDAKKWMVQNGYGPPQRAKDMFKYIATPEYQNPFKEPRESRDEWYREEYTLPEKADVVYFVGCMTSYYEYSLLLSNMKILTAAGVNFTTIGQDEMCCGVINIFTGQHERFKEIAEHNISHIKKREPKIVIANCPGCFRGLLKYKKFVDFDFEILHTMELYARLIKEGKLTFKKEFKSKGLPIAYHDPCELGRIREIEAGKGIYDEPRFILQNIPGIDEVLEFPTNRYDSYCCGGGGGLKAVDYDLSAKITARKIDEAIKKGVKTITSCCPNCKAQISNGIEDRKAQWKAEGKKFKMKMVDIADIMAKSL